MLDDGFDQQTAISDYTRLISQDKVDLLLGTFSSDLNLAVAPIAERYKYVYVEPSGGADEIFERNFKYLFFAQPATTQKLPGRFVGHDRGRARGRAAGDAGARPARRPEHAPARGDLFEERPRGARPETVYQRPTRPTTTNFDTIANAIKQAEPDLVINGAIAGDGIRSSARCRR